MNELHTNLYTATDGNLYSIESHNDKRAVLRRSDGTFFVAEMFVLSDGRISYGHMHICTSKQEAEQLSAALPYSEHKRTPISPKRNRGR